VAQEQRKAAKQAEQLYERVINAKRKASPTEADGKLSWAYLRMGLAYGMARLGLPDRARNLLRSAKAKLPMSDPVHAVLVGAYSERTEQALLGLGPDEPISAEIEEKLDALAAFDRYKVDRLRQASEVLVSQENLDPMRAFMRKIKDSRGEEFEGLRGMSDRAKLAEEIEEICGLASSPNTPLDERARLYEGALDFFPKLNESQVLAHLKTLPGITEGVPGARRAVLLEKALALAGHFGKMSLVEHYVDTLKPILAGLTPKEASEGTAKLGTVLRVLRRLGYNNEASALLGVLEGAAENAGPEMLRYQLQLATARASLGEPEQAQRRHELAFTELKRLRDSRDRGVSERLKLCRSLARSLGALPEEARAAGLQRLEEQQLETMTDRFNTNSHFCLALVAFVEYLIFAYVGEGPGISKRMRQTLDEEEYLLRRRIHRDTMEISR